MTDAQVDAETRRMVEKMWECYDVGDTEGAKRWSVAAAAFTKHERDMGINPALAYAARLALERLDTAND